MQKIASLALLLLFFFFKDDSHSWIVEQEERGAPHACDGVEMTRVRILLPSLAVTSHSLYFRDREFCSV